MAGLAFNQVVVAAENEIEYHADVNDVLRSIKGVGASTAASNNQVGGLGWRGLLADMAGHYRENFQCGQGIPVTYEVVYVIARKS